MPTAVYAEEPEAPWGGSGTETEPYEIWSPEDLATVSDAVYKDYWSVYFILMDDISLSGIDWKPIGDASDQFTGTFDGNGFTISNLTINNNTLEYVGLFGYVGSGGNVNPLGSTTRAEAAVFLYRIYNK